MSPLSVLLVCSIIHAAVSQLPETMEGPSSPSQWSSWYSKNLQFRENELSKVNYNGSIYSVPELQWVQNAYVIPMIFPFDLYFYDANTHLYTIDKWVQFMKELYGGVDAILLWSTYTNLGIDDRNQYEMYLSLPGGITQLTNITNYLNDKYDIKVLLAYNPWDYGTNYSGNPDYVTLSQLLYTINAAGFFGDTMNYVPEIFYTYSVDTYNHPIAFYPEQDPQTFNLSSINYDILDFGIWNINSMRNGPPLSTLKWLEPRHQTAAAFSGNEYNIAQTQFFNAIASTSSEDSWTCYYQITKRNAEMTRRISAMLRFFGAEKRRFLQSLSMKPFIPIFSKTQNIGYLYANEFDRESSKEMVFLIISSKNTDIDTMDLSINNTFNYDDNVHIFDCYHGLEIMEKTITKNKIEITINSDKYGIESNGFGCILITMNSTKTDTELNTFLNSMNAMTVNKPIKSYSNQFSYLQQYLRKINQTKLMNKPDSGMVEIPFGVFYFNVGGVEIEGDDDCVDVQFPFETHAQRYHQQYMTIHKFYIDKYPVTCSQYKTFLDATNYKPTEPYNYLKNWNGNAFPTGYSNKPVTYVSLNEARMYCEWKNKRLPHSYEWQYSAQGNNSNYLFPWGNKGNAGANYPKTQHGRNIPGPEDVDAYTPQGNSIFGVGDLIGNVWQFTDEFYSEHTRSVILRGSSNYYPLTKGGFDINWYFPTAFQLNQHGRYYIMDDTWERAGTVGFRCAADAVQSAQSLNNKTVYNWNGNGNYCVNPFVGNGDVLCGSIQAPKGYNNLTEIGTLDWVQFGLNQKGSVSAWYSIRKQTNQEIITDFVNMNSAQISSYDNNINSFVWNDGQIKYPNYEILTMNNASTSGVYINPSNNHNQDVNRGFSFNLSNLKGGNIYKVYVFVGVWSESGHLKVNIDVNNKENYVFEDFSVSGIGTTENVCYEIIINLSSIATNELIKVIIEWLLKNGTEGNITIQAIAVQQI